MSDFEPIDAKEMKSIVFMCDEIEIRLSYYVTDVFQRQAIDAIQDYMEANPKGSLSDYEDNHDLIPHDRVDKKNKRIAAQIFAYEDGSKSYAHFNRGEPDNLYGMACQYDTDDEGDILYSSHCAEDGVIDNTPAENAAFVHAYLYHENARMMKKEVNPKLCTEELSIRMVNRMGLN